MAFVETQKYLEKLVLDNDYDLFKTTVFISNVSKELKRLSYDSILESESIRWAITGKEPEDIGRRIHQHMNVLHNKSSYMEKLLGYIDSEDICDAVRYSFDTSVKIGNLFFGYCNVKEQELKVRVRILTRMCWYNREELFETI